MSLISFWKTTPVLLFLASIIALLPVVLIKYYINNNNNIYLYLSLLSYILLIYLYIKIFKYREISSNYIILKF